MRTPTEIVVKIDGLLEKRGVTRSNMLTSLNINTGYLRDLIRKDVLPTVDKIGAIAQYLNVSIDDLLDTRPEQIEPHKTTQLPFFAAPVSAGSGQWIYDGKDYEIEDFENVPEGADFALRVRGDSMSPMYRDGEIILGKSNVFVESGQIGVFVLNGEGFVKQLFGNKLISMNPEYPPIIIGEDDSFFCAGRVLGKAQC